MIGRLRQLGSVLCVALIAALLAQSIGHMSQAVGAVPLAVASVAPSAEPAESPDPALSFDSIAVECMLHGCDAVSAEPVGVPDWLGRDAVGIGRFLCIGGVGPTLPERPPRTVIT